MTAANQQAHQRELRHLLRARTTLLWIVTHEEQRAEEAIAAAIAPAGYQLRTWDCAAGAADLHGNAVDLAGGTGLPDTTPHAVLAHIRATTDLKALWVLRDLHDWLTDPVVVRALRTTARQLRERPVDQLAALAVLAPSPDVPLNLRGLAVVIDWPLPDRDEIAKLLADLLDSNEIAIGDERDLVIDAAMGLSREEARTAFSRSLVELGRVDPALVTLQKKRAIDRERVLTWYPPDPRGLDAVGGLERLKAWLIQRRLALTPQARAYRLPPPKGVLLVGHPGCGKSLTAKALPTAWGVPLLRLDLAGLKGSHVGESEANIRRAVKIAEACAPVALWIDEIEKALAGAASSGDSGVAADQLGTLLTWLQERVGLVFVVATANDVASLPPELIRKGRFDEIFFVDLPAAGERAAVLAAALASHGRDPQAFDLSAVAAATTDFSGAEVAELVPTALFAAFADGEREPALEDLLAAAAATTPTARAAAPRVKALRDWAAVNAQRASAPDVADTTALPRGTHRLDLTAN